MANIKWIELDGEKVAMRKSWDGWRVINPIKNEDGSINKKNLIGSWQKWVKSIAILLIILGFYYIYAHDTALCRETVARDVTFWANYSHSIMNQNPNLPAINFSTALTELNKTGT